MSGCGGGWGAQKPTIASESAGQAQTQTVTAGRAVTFTVTPTGTGPFTYQWYLTGVAIQGAVSNSYTIETTTSDNGSVYTAAVSNAAGTTMSAPFVLVVNTPPAITLQPASQTVTAGQSATFMVTATGTAPLSYQWYQGATAITGATGPTYTTPATAISNSGAVYTVTVTNVVGTVASAAATLTVAPLVPTLSFAPIAPQTYGNAPFAVSASSASSGAVTYTVASGPATILGNMVTPTGAGTVVLSASQAASGTYAATTATTSITINAEVPLLSFAPIAAQTYGGAAFAVSATSASSGAVTYTVASGPAKIVGNMVTLTGVGTVVLSASQAASGNYTVTTATASFTVGNSTPVASSLVASSSTPPYNASVNLVATFSGGTAMIGSTGVGSSDVSASAVSGGSYATSMLTSAKTYTLTVTGTGGNIVTTAVTVNPTSVTITSITPANQTMAGAPQAFSATASGGATDSLTWSSAAGGTFSGNTWTPPNTPGAYTITATSVDNPAVSVTTQATISAPVITAQPVSKNVCSGYSQSLSIGANYATNYQWFFNGGAIGNNSSTLSFPDISTSNSGNYSSTVSSGAGSVSSNTVTLSVVNPTTLTITTQPSSVSVYSTQTATFSVGASGTGILAYQWYTGTPGSGTKIALATSSSYTTAALTAANSGTTYYVTVSDPDCTGTTLTSNAATLSVSDTDTAVPPTIDVQPTGQTVSVGGTATFSVTASGSGTLSYQWYRVPYSSTELSSPTAGVPISGATSTTYTVPSSETAQSNDGDHYFVLVSNAYGQAVSSRVVLAVGAGIMMQITDQPKTDYVAANTLASFSTTATCTGCTPAYQWYWYAPGTTTATALSNGLVSAGDLNGATVAGATSSALTLQYVPTTSTAGIFYVAVTSTSDGTTPIAGTNPLTSSTAGLFVGSLGTVGNTTPGSGLCNSSSNSWVLNGTTTKNGPNTGGTTSGDVPYQNTTACTLEMTNDKTNEQAAVYWPTLISTANFSVSFKVTLSNPAGGSPADGFTMVLADPSQGANTSMTGAVGYGLGAEGIPGFVLGFDTYQNGNQSTTPNCTYYNSESGTNVPCDPITVPYMAVGQGASTLWENPWSFVNGDLDTQSSKDYTAAQFVPTTGTQAHNYVVTVVGGVMTVTMDGYELFSGAVSLPPVAYLGLTASTGGLEETLVFSNLTATVSAP